MEPQNGREENSCVIMRSGQIVSVLLLHGAMRVSSGRYRFDGFIFGDFRKFLVAMFACIHSTVEISLTEFAYGFSPIVEERRKGTVVIDVEGCELLFGSPYQLASEVVKRAEIAVSVARSEEHTSELQSLAYLVCRLLF